MALAAGSVDLELRRRAAPPLSDVVGAGATCTHRSRLKPLTAVSGRHGYSSWRDTPRPSVWSWSQPTPAALIAVPLFLGLGLGERGIRMIELNASTGSVAGGVLLVFVALVPLVPLVPWPRISHGQ